MLVFRVKFLFRITFRIIRAAIDGAKNPIDKLGQFFKNYAIIINVNIKMYIFDHLRMYIFAILPLDRYIFLSDKIFL